MIKYLNILYQSLAYHLSCQDCNLLLCLEFMLFVNELYEILTEVFVACFLLVFQIFRYERLLCLCNCVLRDINLIKSQDERLCCCFRSNRMTCLMGDNSIYACFALAHMIGLLLSLVGHLNQIHMVQSHKVCLPFIHKVAYRDFDKHLSFNCTQFL